MTSPDFHEYQPSSPKEDIEHIVVVHLSGLLEAGAWSVDEYRFTATLLFHGLHGVIHEALAKEKRVARNPLVAKLRQLCFRAFGLKT